MATELGELATLKAGCKIGDSVTAQEQLECLQNVPAETLLKLAKTDYLPTPSEVLTLILQWQPAVDGELVVDTPINQFQKGQFNKVPMYVSNVANETAIFVGGLNIPVSTLLLDIALDYILGFTDAKEIEDLYGPIPTNFTWHDPNGVQFFSLILTDYTFYCPAKYMADIVSNAGLPVHFGYYDLVESWVPWYDNNTGDICNILPCHAYDLVSYFYDPYSMPSYFPKFPTNEQGLSQFMQHAVGTSVTQKGEAFPAYNTSTRYMYNYSLPLPRPLLSNYRQKYCDMWDKIGYNRH
jgi:carboxylesterase type B